MKILTTYAEKRIKITQENIDTIQKIFSKMFAFEIYDFEHFGQITALEITE